MWVDQNLKNPQSSEARVFRDLINKQILEMEVGHDKVVVIAAGNALSEMSAGQARSLEQMTRELVNKGYRILYDADAKGAEAIKAAAGDVALGISGNNAASGDRVVVIENPYMRMESFLAAREIIMTPDSVLGVGLLFEGQGMSNVKFRVLDTEGKWTSGLGQWKKDTFDFEFFPREALFGRGDTAQLGETKSEGETNVAIDGRAQDDATGVKTSTPITSPTQKTNPQDKPQKTPPKGFLAALKDEARPFSLSAGMVF
jgi:hypothetical protein